MIYKKVIRKLIRVLESTIKEERHPVYDEDGLTFEDLKEEFSRLPVEDDAVIFVHSGLRSLGKLNGGAEMVVNAMVKALVADKGITIAMPSFTISSSMAVHLEKSKPFDVRKTQTVFKAIPLAFQNLSDVERSIHPSHSVAAIGPKAKWLVKDHHTCGSTFGKGSPFGKLLDCNGYIVGLGTRLGTVTFYHALEDIEPDFPRRVYTENSPISVKCIGYNGETIKMEVNAHDPKAFKTRIDYETGACIRHLYTSVLNERECLQWAKVGKANTWICNAVKMYDTVKDLTYAGLSIYSTEDDIAHFATSKIYSNDHA